MDKKTWVVVTGVTIIAVAAFAHLSGEAAIECDAPYRLRPSSPADLESEMAFYRARIERRPDQGLDLAALASLHLKKKDYAGAEDLARRSLKNLPVFNPGAHIVLAEVAQARHDFAMAIRIGTDVHRAHPRNLDALSLLVKTHLAIGDLGRALKYADELVARRPLMTQLALRAQVLAALGRSEEAIAEFRRALSKEEGGETETSAWVRTLLARVHARQGRAEKAHALLIEAIRIWPATHLAYSVLADVQLTSGDADGADESLSRGYQVSGEAIYLVRKARLKSDVVLRDHAESLLRAELARGPFGHRRALAEVLLDRGAVDEARELLEQELKVRRDTETVELAARAGVQS